MIKMVIFCVIAFALTWLPFNTLLVLGDVHPDIWEHQDIMYIWFITHFLAMCHTITNPLIYIWMNNRFRAGFKQAISELCRPARWLLVYLWYHLCCLAWCLKCSDQKYRQQLRSKMSRRTSCRRLTSTGSFQLNNNNNHHNHHNQLAAGKFGQEQAPTTMTRSTRVCYSSTGDGKSDVNCSRNIAAAAHQATGSEVALSANSAAIPEVNELNQMGSSVHNKPVVVGQNETLFGKVSVGKREKRRRKCKECQLKQVEAMRRLFSEARDSSQNQTSETTFSLKVSTPSSAAIRSSIEEEKRIASGSEGVPKKSDKNRWLIRKLAPVAGKCRPKGQTMKNNPTNETATSESPFKGPKRKRTTTTTRQREKQSHVINIELTTREDHPAAVAARTRLLICQTDCRKGPAATSGCLSNDNNEGEGVLLREASSIGMAGGGQRGKRRRSGKARQVAGGRGERAKKRKKSSSRLTDSLSLACGVGEFDIGSGSGTAGEQRRCSRCKIKRNEPGEEEMNRQSSLSTATISVQTNTTSLQVSSPNSTEVAQRQQQQPNNRPNNNNFAQAPPFACCRLLDVGQSGPPSGLVETSHPAGGSRTKVASWSLRGSNSEPDALGKINRAFRLASTRSMEGAAYVSFEPRKPPKQASQDYDRAKSRWPGLKWTPDTPSGPPFPEVGSDHAELSDGDPFCNGRAGGGEGRFSARDTLKGQRSINNNKGRSLQQQETEEDLVSDVPFSASFPQASPTISNNKGQLQTDNNYEEDDDDYFEELLRDEQQTALELEEADQLFAEYGDDENEPSSRPTNFQQQPLVSQVKLANVDNDTGASHKSRQVASNGWACREAREKTIRVARLRLTNKLFKSAGDDLGGCLEGSELITGKYLKEKRKKPTNEPEGACDKNSQEAEAATGKRWPPLEGMKGSANRNRSLRHAMLLNNHLLNNLLAKELLRADEDASGSSCQVAVEEAEELLSRGEDFESFEGDSKGFQLKQGLEEQAKKCNLWEREVLEELNENNHRSCFSASDPNSPLTSGSRFQRLPRRQINNSTATTNGYTTNGVEFASLAALNTFNIVNSSDESQQAKPLLSKHAEARQLPVASPEVQLGSPAADSYNDYYCAGRFGGAELKQGKACGPPTNAAGTVLSGFRTPEVARARIINGCGTTNELCRGLADGFESNNHLSSGCQQTAEAMSRKAGPNTTTIYLLDKKASPSTNNNSRLL